MSIGAITNARVQQVNFNGGTNNVERIDLKKNGVTTTVWQRAQRAKFRLQLAAIPNWFNGPIWWNLFAGSGQPLKSGNQTVGEHNLSTITIVESGSGYQVNELVEAIHPCTTTFPASAVNDQSGTYNIYPMDIGHSRGYSTVRGLVEQVNSTGGITRMSFPLSVQNDQRIATYQFGRVSDNRALYQVGDSDNANYTGQPVTIPALWTASLPGEGPATVSSPPTADLCNEGGSAVSWNPYPQQDTSGDAGGGDGGT